MARIGLDDLRAGLRLKTPVFNLHGALLLKAGEVLTAKHLGLLKTWGIRELDVQGRTGRSPPPQVAA